MRMRIRSPAMSSRNHRMLHGCFSQCTYDICFPHATHRSAGLVPRKRLGTCRAHQTSPDACGSDSAVGIPCRTPSARACIAGGPVCTFVSRRWRVDAARRRPGRPGCSACLEAHARRRACSARGQQRHGVAAAPHQVAWYRRSAERCLSLQTSCHAGSPVCDFSDRESSLREKSRRVLIAGNIQKQNFLLSPSLGPLLHPGATGECGEEGGCGHRTKGYMRT